MENSVLYISLYLNIQINRFEQLQLENVTVREASACQTTTFFNFSPFLSEVFWIKDLSFSLSSSPSDSFSASKIFIFRLLLLQVFQIKDHHLRPIQSLVDPIQSLLITKLSSRYLHLIFVLIGPEKDFTTKRPSFAKNIKKIMPLSCTNKLHEQRTVICFESQGALHTYWMEFSFEKLFRAVDMYSRVRTANEREFRGRNNCLGVGHMSPYLLHN